MGTNQPKQFSLSLRPDLLIAVGLTWSYLMHDLHARLDTWWMAALVIAAIMGCSWFYRDASCRRSLTFTVVDLLVFTAFLAVNVLLHSPWLFASLAGDEMYHGKRTALILLGEWRDWFYATPGMDWAYYIEEPRRRFDFHHLAVSDIWRITAMFFLMAVVALSWGVRRFSRERIVPVCIVLIVLVGWAYGQASDVTSDVHPPLRLLPYFAGTCIFGFNAFAFRMTSLIVVTLISFSVFRFLAGPVARLTRDHVVYGLIAFSVGLIPTIFYLGDALEPSVLGVLLLVVMMLLGLHVTAGGSRDMLIWMGLLAGIGSLCRHTCIVLWLYVGILALLHLKPFDFKWLLRVFLPGLFVLPYLISTKLHAHAGYVEQSELPALLVDSVTSGLSLSTALYSTSIPWLVVGGLAFLLACRKLRWTDYLPFLLFIPQYYLFFTVHPDVQGSGRYQAEYIAPYLILALVFFARHRATQMPGRTGIVFILLLAFSVETRVFMTRDINYGHWKSMKVTTAAYFPYEKVFAMLRREEAMGRFSPCGWATC